MKRMLDGGTPHSTRRARLGAAPRRRNSPAADSGNEWWIRIWDFPRFQIAALIGLVLLVSLLLRPRGSGTVTLTGALLIALGWQAYSVWPYTPFHAVEAKMAAGCPKPSTVRVLVANVLYTNENTAPLFAQIADLKPDLVLLVETDRHWDQRLLSLQADFPFMIRHPREGGDYGLHLLSNFELIDPQVRFLLDDYVPSIKTGVKLPSGATIALYGLHPKPPPLSDTARRDAELMLVAQEVRREPAPAIVAGDLNDVAWSRTTRLFQEVGGLLDPRIGRGPYATFNANWPLLRWPLDHVFFEETFRLLDFKVLGHIGSDHFPVFAALCHAPAPRPEQPGPRAEPADLEAAREAIREGREEARERD